MAAYPSWTAFTSSVIFNYATVTIENELYIFGGMQMGENYDYGTTTTVGKYSNSWTRTGDMKPEAAITIDFL